MARIMGMMCLLALSAGASWAQTSAAEPASAPRTIPAGTYTSTDGTEAVITSGGHDVFFSVVIHGVSNQGERRVEMTLPCTVHPDRSLTCAVSSNDVDAMDLVWYQWTYDHGRITRTHPDNGRTVAFVNNGVKAQ